MKKKQVLAAVLCALCLADMAGSVYAVESSGETVAATPTPAKTGVAPTSVAVKKANQAVDSAKEEKETIGGWS